jgi:RNA polymerase sigma factor (sigma-70 family)
MDEDPSVTDLVIRAKAGDHQAWDRIVERYAPLVWSICRRYRLNGTDGNDVGQNVWLRLVDQLANLREPAALPGWLATTTRRECLRVLRAAPQSASRQIWDAGNLPDDHNGSAERGLLTAERNAALRQAFGDLPPCCQRLLALLIQDPPLPYTQISVMLGRPIGSLGPSRARCLGKLRRHPAIAALIDPQIRAGTS